MAFSPKINKWTRLLIQIVRVGERPQDRKALSITMYILRIWFWSLAMMEKPEIPWHFPMPPLLQPTTMRTPEPSITEPSAPALPLEEPPLCAGCHLRIVDKYFLSALDSKWHTSCLKCSECGMELESQISCYERDGLILCKEDYNR